MLTAIGVNPLVMQLPKREGTEAKFSEVVKPMNAVSSLMADSIVAFTTNVYKLLSLSGGRNSGYDAEPSFFSALREQEAHALLFFWERCFFRGGNRVRIELCLPPWGQYNRDICGTKGSNFPGTSNTGTDAIGQQQEQRKQHYGGGLASHYQMAIDHLLYTTIIRIFFWLKLRLVSG